MPLFADVEKDIPWARVALQNKPEAINIWIGNSKSVSALHKDNYENIYCQIIGEKHFVLLPPIAHACVGEQELASASYIRHDAVLQAEKEKGGSLVPFPTWDPDTPEVRPTAYSHFAQIMRVTLKAGDLLYLPALWRVTGYLVGVTYCSLL
jgi:jumonji domain-containing protein 7